LTCSSNRKLKSLPYYDSYSFEFGIRSISWSGTENNKQAWKINSEPFYCAGVNRHEDAAVIGRGIDFVMIFFYSKSFKN
jgi:beta-galactosidase/beta-glucuronidase